MTMSMYLLDVTKAISQFSVPGVKFVDYNGLAASWKMSDGVVYMIPENGVLFAAPEWISIMQSDNAPVDLKYQLNYRFLSTQVGSEASLPTAHGLMIERVVAIYNAMVVAAVPVTDNGRVFMRMGAVNSGIRRDPVGNNYFGADFSVSITEMQF